VIVCEDLENAMLQVLDSEGYIVQLSNCLYCLSKEKGRERDLYIQKSKSFFPLELGVTQHVTHSFKLKKALTSRLVESHLSKCVTH
jgi:hypothetical protein